ncbi:MAG: sensor histidine kinase, partial [Candidatus Limnocylindria bacterium]
ADGMAVGTQVLGLGTVLAYYVGFAPPRVLRRAWQEPAIRAMLAEATEMVQLPDLHAIADRISERAVAATGGEGAAVGLWNEAEGVLTIRLAGGEESRMGPGEFIAGRAFAAQQAIFSSNPARDAPEHADMYRRSGIQAVAAAPITADDRRLGVLVVYAARPPVFSDDVLSLITILAEQAALVLRSHELLREAAQVRALAEVTRMKDDFLSVVAHDVRTPLTTILINAELLEQAIAGAGDARNARRAVSLRAEALRLKQLVEDYLDVVRAERGREPRLEDCDLAALVRTTIDAMGAGHQRVVLEAQGPVHGRFDPARIHQLVENLVANAMKYSGTGDPVEVRVWNDDGRASLSVADRGIGIPETDLPFLFERFHRGSNTDDRRYGGLGLGLYICRQIAEEHGGSITVSSRIGEGTTFVVAFSPMPAAAAAAEVRADA